MFKLKRIKVQRLIEHAVVFTIIFLFDLIFMFRYSIKISIPYYLLSIASISLLPGIILFFKSSKTRFILYSILLFFNLAIFIADTCLFYYKQDIFAWAMLMDIGDGLKMGIKYNILIAFNWWQWIIIFTVIGLLFFILKQMTTGQNKTKNKIQLKYLLIIGLSGLLLLSSGLIIKREDISLYQTPQDKRAYILTFGMSTFNQKDAVVISTQLLGKKIYALQAKEKLETIDEETHSPHSTKFGSLAGQNVIMIMLETVEEYTVDSILTPTLYSLLNDGYNFSNTYGVAKTNYTYDAEFKSLTSMMYYNSDNIMHSYADNEFKNALPYLMKEAGYTANSFHSYYGDYFNRDEMHQALGFDHFYSNEDMEFSEVDFWPLDSEFLTQMKDLYIPIQEQPFFSFLITLSTHGSYKQERTEFSPYYQIIEADGRFADYEPEFINLLAAHMDLDKGLEAMMDDLTNKDLLDETLIVLFSDHKNYSSIEITEKYTPIELENSVYRYELDRVPFSLYHPSFPTLKTTLPLSQYDILPTICDVMGISLIKEYYYGQSAFLHWDGLREDKPIIFGYNRWMDSNMIVFDKEIIYFNPTLDDPDAYLLEKQTFIFNTIEKFHAFFITDYFRETAQS
ncbi:MAG: sulfatase-like hydrolase/transferase [Bacilli bacterium]|jgi:phosphoglycerol transferase MdoB-like AlkP superfamily enzyme|nr:sulfatase-like hydrolase/transferase [Bacilli bacterium]